MAAGKGDYGWWRRVYEDISGDLTVAAATGDTTLVAAKANYTIYVQKIHFHVTTTTAQSMAFTDSADTPVPIAEVPASPGDETDWEYDFLEKGIALTEGKALLMNVSATGLAGRLSWQGYRRLTAVTSVP